MGNSTAKLHRALYGRSRDPSDLRIVLLGHSDAGQKSVIKAILGCHLISASQRTATCLYTVKDVVGRQIDVVSTPSWQDGNVVRDSPELIKREIMLSVSLCPPGPHCLLLIIPMDDTFTEKSRKAIQQHVEILGTDVWNHTVVLFLSHDWMGASQDEYTDSGQRQSFIEPIEQYIEHQGTALQWLVEQCGMRYHVLSSYVNLECQVSELLEKIEDIVRINCGKPFKMDKRKLQKLRESRELEQKRAKERTQRRMMKTRTVTDVSSDMNSTDLRIVLLGCRAAGKSSTGNTILNRQMFDVSQRTAECIKKSKQLMGREVTVVDTPGWWSNVPLMGSAQITKDEIVRSVSLCPPGPHAFIIVISVDISFREEDRVALEEHVELLGPSVWDHTIVLFTSGKWLGETPIEEHIECEGHALQWVIYKCGNRYHVFDNMEITDIMQVIHLFKMIDCMVDKNSGSHFEIDQRKCQEMEDKRRTVREKAENRQMRSYRKRATLQFIMGKCLFLSEIRIILLGPTKAGKSSSGNTIFQETSGSTEVFEMSETSHCVKKTATIAMRQVTVVDTPGWNKEQPITNYQQNISKQTKAEIRCSKSFLPSAPHAVLLVIDLESSFTEEHRRAAQEHLELLGRNVWHNTIVLFAYADYLGEKSIEQHIENEGEALQWIIRKCGNRYHVFDNTQKKNNHQVKELLEKIEEMGAVNFLYQDCSNMDWLGKEELIGSLHTPPNLDPSVPAMSSDSSLDVSGQWIPWGYTQEPSSPLKGSMTMWPLELHEDSEAGSAKSGSNHSNRSKRSFG